MLLFSWASRVVTKWRRVHFGAIDLLEFEQSILDEPYSVASMSATTMCIHFIFDGDVGDSFSSRMPSFFAWRISNAQLMQIKQTTYTFFLWLPNFVDVPLLRSRLATPPNKWERESESKHAKLTKKVFQYLFFVTALKSSSATRTPFSLMVQRFG